MRLRLRSLLGLAAPLLLLTAAPDDVLANSGGKTGSTTGCSCHSGGTAPEVVIQGPTSVKPGTKALLKLLITHKASGQTAGGFNVKASAGALSVSTTDTGVKVSGGEVTHTGTKSASSGVTTFEFEWTAPSNFTTVTISGAGNSVNKNGGTSGDMFKVASLTITRECEDSDSDGATASSCGGTDCNDADAAINPSAAEVVGDGVDQNCDAVESCYLDADNDGYRPDGGATTASADTDCNDANEATASDPTGDCNDALNTVFPSALEVCNGLDDDCDSLTDDADESVSGQNTYFTDLDGDGFGNEASPSETCAPAAPEGFSADSTDCNDGDELISPDAEEVCDDTIDQDCNGSDLACPVTDADSDGYGPDTGDCNDNNAGVNPGAAEICGDELDQNCDGADTVCPTPTPVPPTPTAEPETPTAEPETPTAEPETPTAEPETPSSPEPSPTEPPGDGDDDAASCSCSVPATRPLAPLGSLALFLLAGWSLRRRRH